MHARYKFKKEKSGELSRLKAAKRTGQLTATCDSELDPVRIKDVIGTTSTTQVGFEEETTVKHQR